MATRSLSVQITGDARSLNRVLDSTESRTKRWGGAMAKGFAVAGAAAAGGLAVGLKKSADAAIEAEKSQAKLTAQLRASGISFAKHRVEIDKAIQSHSKLSGFDDEDLTDSFTNIVRVTGDVDKSLRLTGLAADFARAKHIDVAKAGELVGKVAGGNTGILSRYGITLDKGATSAEALAVLQQKFAGQAEAYGKTTAGALDRAGVASENLGEIVGAKLTPLLAKGATALVDLVDKAGTLAGPIRQVSGVVGNFARRVHDAFHGGNKDATALANNVQERFALIAKFVRDLGRTIGRIFAGSGDDFRTIGRALLKVGLVFNEVITEIVRRILPILKAAIEGIAGIIRGVVKIVAGILKGDFRQAWQGAKDVVRSAVKGIAGIIKGLWDVLKDAMVGLAKVMIRGLVAGLKGIGSAVFNGIKAGINAAIDKLGDWLDKANPLSSITGNIGDGIGRVLGRKAGDGLGFLGGSAGGSGAGLMGADLDLGPFARIGAGMGLRTSSGLRPGAVTSSGNPSYHATGDAIDMAGPPSAMGRFFKTMRGMFGSKLRELIYTPGGTGIKDGRPYTYSGQTAADHYDHVHVAYTGPFGDGIGKAAGGWKGQTKDLMGRIWGAAAPFFGGGRMPKTVLTTGADALFVGADETGTVYWPKWASVGQGRSKGLLGGDDAMEQLLIHEWAHTRQKKGLSMWEGEGGATGFARRAAPGIFAALGLPFANPTLKGDPYLGFLRRVKKERGEGFIAGGQFRKPGTGDGLGRFSSTAYGPPWGGIQGTGVTATGVNLKGSPHRYGVAVDPSVIPLGTRLKIKPNPFNYGGYFTAFDTGGAIKGNRIDFYDWRGRASQMRWGSRAVTVWTEDEAPTAAERRSGHARGRVPSPATQLVGKAGRGRGGLGTGSKYVMGPNGFPVLRSSVVPFQSGPAKGRQPDDWYLPAAEAVSDPAAEALTAAIEASTKATEDHTAALNATTAAIDAQTKLAQQYASTSEFQKTKYIADIFSGQFGRGIIGRGFTAGVGVEVAYEMSIFQVA